MSVRRSRKTTRSVVDQESWDEQKQCRQFMNKLEGATYTLHYFVLVAMIFTLYTSTILIQPVLFFSLFFLGFAIPCISYQNYTFDYDRIIMNQQVVVYNTRVRFLEFKYLMISLCIMLAFVFCISYDKSRQGKGYGVHLTRFSQELFYMDPRNRETRMIEFLCPYPCHESSFAITSKFAKNKLNLDAKRLIQYHQLVDRMHVGHCFVWVLLGYFTGFALVLHHDWIECRQNLLMNGEERQNLLADRYHPDTPWDRAFGERRHWSTEQCEDMCYFIKSARNTMCHFLMSDLGSVPARVLLIFMAANYVVPTVYACYLFIVPMSCMTRHDIWIQSPTLLLWLPSPITWTLLISLVQLRRCWVAM